MSTTSSLWWNTSWHYRRVYNVTGTGNLSVSVNFTSVLSGLHVVNKTFENSTIMIVQYLANGTINLCNRTWFNESPVFNNRTNAQGTLAWTVSTPASYHVYFDVKENRGTRSSMTETPNITSSGTVRIIKESTHGWGSVCTNTWETYYLPHTLLPPLTVNTAALAKNITARFTCDNHAIVNQSLSSFDSLSWVGGTLNLSTRGNWTVTISGYDDAGYSPSVLSFSFYVGTPDLSVTALSIQDVCYLMYNITVSASIRATNATVHQVNVSLLYENHTIVSRQSNLTFLKGKTSTIDFTWLPNHKGRHTLTVRVDFTDSNLTNNKRWKTIMVEGIPDLGVGNISVTPTPVDEGDPVTISTRIYNTGDGNASNYVVKLFCEQNENNHTMYYANERNSTTISVKQGASVVVNLTWSETTYGKSSFHGEWAVGIKILNTTTTPDKFGANNTRALYHVLWVTPSERNPPVISNLNYPRTIEENQQGMISAQVTDASGVGSVIISIRTPNRAFVNASMTPSVTTSYEYVFTFGQIGSYAFSITATDLSPYRNHTTVRAAFDVTKDLTPPTIEYFGAIPAVQLNSEAVEIRCIASDFSGITSVKVTLSPANDTTVTHVMTNASHDMKYSYTARYDTLGEYTYSITVTDTRGNQNITPLSSFWITDDLNDTDSDGMPDAWELRYGFNPLDPTDANQDANHNGVTNLEEYRQGTNPLKTTPTTSDLFTRLQENWEYLVASILVFILIVLLAMYGMRRRRPKA
jgi:hypothetical protein